VLLIILLLAALAVLGGVVLAALGRAGEMAAFPGDGTPLEPDLAEMDAAGIALLRPPMALWGYQVQATEETFGMIARSVAARDAEIAVLRQEVASLRNASGGKAAGDQGSGATAAWPRAGQEPGGWPGAAGHREGWRATGGDPPGWPGTGAGPETREETVWPETREEPVWPETRHGAARWPETQGEPVWPETPGGSARWPEPPGGSARWPEAGRAQTPPGRAGGGPAAWPEMAGEPGTQPLAKAEPADRSTSRPGATAPDWPSQPGPGTDG
jgi:hypothetical protein